MLMFWLIYIVLLLTSYSCSTAGSGIKWFLYLLTSGFWWTIIVSPKHSVRNKYSLDGVLWPSVVGGEFAFMAGRCFLSYLLIFKSVLGGLLANVPVVAQGITFSDDLSKAEFLHCSVPRNF